MLRRGFTVAHLFKRIPYSRHVNDTPRDTTENSLGPNWKQTLLINSDLNSDLKTKVKKKETETYLLLVKHRPL